MSQKSILVVAMVHLFSKKTRFRPKVFSATMIVWKETEFFSLLHVLHVRSLRLRCKNSKKVKGSLNKNMCEGRNSQTNKKKIKY
jgi:hypothetical protein